MFDSAQAILFDFDGTLIDSSRLICESFNRALAAKGQKPVPATKIRAMIGEPLRTMFEKTTGSTDANLIEALVESYRESFMPLSVNLVEPLPGAESLLSRLSRHYSLAVVTSRTRSGTVEILRAFNLLSCFKSVVGIEDVVCSKPHPEPLLLALDRLAVEAERAVMVGDTIHDMEAACRAGTYAVGITTGPHSDALLRRAGAQHVVPDLLALTELVSLDDTPL